MDQLKVKRNIIPFNGDKYSVWKFRIRSLLTELNVIKVIDAEVPVEKPENWDKAENIAKSVIIEYLSDSFLGFANGNVTAKQIIENLDKIYERKSLATQLAVRKKLLSLKLQGDIPLVKHFAVFNDLITELSAAGAKLEETDKVAHLLLTLPSSYDGVITAIETLSEDTLTLAFVKTRLLDHEVKMKAESTDTSGKVLYTGNTTRQSDFEISKTKDFTRKYRQFNRFKNNRKIPGIKCHHCNKLGHIKRECRYYLKDLKQKNSRETEKRQTNQTAQMAQQSSSFDRSSFAFMTGDYEIERSEKNEITFLMDSGASDHLINKEDLTKNFVNLNPPIKVGVAKNGCFILATKIGPLNVISNVGVEGVLKDVLYSAEVPRNLLSISKLREAKLRTVLDEKEISISKNGRIIATGNPVGNTFQIKFFIKLNEVNSIVKLCKVRNIDYDLWHQRLGHIGKNKFVELQKNKMVSDISQIEKIIPNDKLCEACINGKQKRLPFNKVKDKSNIKRPLFVVHSDVSGPITPPTFNNKNYFVLFVDEFTHYCVTYLITFKSDVFSVFRDYISKAEARFNSKVVNLYCDNGREYLSTEMKDYCIQKGISYHLTVPRTPQQNGVSERMVRTVTERARTMISGACLDKTYWGEAVLTATYLINIAPTKALKGNKTPYELWHEKKPQIKDLKVFGSTVYIHNKISKTKFDEKSWKGILVGYEPNGYKVWDVSSEKLVIARDVIVDEIDFLKTRPKAKTNEITLKESETGVEDISKPVEPSDKVRKMGEWCSNDSSSHENILNKDLKQIRRSERLRSNPPISYDENEIPDDYILCAQSITCKIPKCYAEVRENEHRTKWEEAMKEEINSLLVNKTWTLVSRPENKNIVDCKWVFTVKNDENGNPIRYKARLVARGFSQEYLLDYNETFSPVARIASFRFLIAFANQFELLIHHMDVKTAFLNGKLKEEIYMRVPDGIENKRNLVCKLNKSLYGLKQAARCWNETFDQTLKELGFKNSAVDPCLYISEKGDISKNIYIILYVDDLLIITARIEVMNKLKSYLMDKFSMVDLKEIKLFLGIRVTRNEKEITLDQSAYISTVLSKFNMQDCQIVNTPMETKLNYTALNLDEKYDAPCRNLIGCLMYLMVCTRPDLSSTVNILSRFTNKNNKELWINLKRVLRYLKGSINLELTYTKGDDNSSLIGYVDSDWGSNEIDRKSTTGYLFQLFHKCTISWNTKRQLTVAASTTEAEYMALFEAVREALWLRSLAKSMNFRISEPIEIFEDNTGCISIANNPTSHRKTKHIDIKYHFCREQIEKSVVKLIYIPTGQQLADALTKPLPTSKFTDFRMKMYLK